MKANINYGLIISMFMHIFILSLPFTKLAENNFKEIEFVLIDTANKKESNIERVPIKKDKRKVEIPKEEKVEQKVEEKKIVEEVKKEEPKELEPTGIKNEEKIPEIPVKPIEKTLSHPTATIVTKNEHISSDVTEKNISDIQKTPKEVEFGSIDGPKFLKRELPKYPLFAKKLMKEGRVLLRLHIDRDGSLVNIEVLENPGYGFAESAVEAIKKSTFLPAKENGIPIASKALLPIRFTLRREE
ncbi:MAG: energy transducer TonB [bacterium]